MLQESVGYLAPHIVGSTTPRANGSAEAILAEVLAGVVCVDRVSVDSHFFDDLGANSLVMAQFCARVRKRPDLPSVSMKDIYRHPTIRSLATALAGPAPAAATATTAVPIPYRVRATAVVTTPGSTPRYVLCGALQLLVFLGYSLPRRRGHLQRLRVDLRRARAWSTSTCGRSSSAARASSGLCTFPILAKWMLIGRWKPREIRIWSLAYVRFWIVKMLIHVEPDGPLRRHPALRALPAGAGREDRQGRHDPLPDVPVCTDLLTIGDGTVIRKDAFFLCYRAHAGRIQTGPVTLGQDVFVGEKTVLDIDTSMGDGAQLGHASALHAGQRAGRRALARLPGAAHRRGLPAGRRRRTAAPLRRAGYGLASVLQVAAGVRAAAWSAASCLLLTAGPALGTVLLDPRPPAIGSAGLLRRGAGPLARAVLRLRRRRPRRRDHRAAAAEPRRSSRTRSIRCTASTTRSTGRSPG